MDHTSRPTMLAQKKPWEAGSQPAKPNQTKQIWPYNFLTSVVNAINWTLLWSLDPKYKLTKHRLSGVTKKPTTNPQDICVHAKSKLNNKDRDSVDRQMNKIHGWMTRQMDGWIIHLCRPEWIPLHLCPHRFMQLCLQHENQQYYYTDTFLLSIYSYTRLCEPVCRFLHRHSVAIWAQCYFRRLKNQWTSSWHTLHIHDCNPYFTFAYSNHCFGYIC
jgi:hypothetical protein